MMHPREDYDDEAEDCRRQDRWYRRNKRLNDREELENGFRSRPECKEDLESEESNED